MKIEWPISENLLNWLSNDGNNSRYQFIGVVKKTEASSLHHKNSDPSYRYLSNVAALAKWVNYAGALPYVTNVSKYLTVYLTVQNDWRCQHMTSVLSATLYFLSLTNLSVSLYLQLHQALLAVSLPGRWSWCGTDNWERRWTTDQPPRGSQGSALRSDMDNWNRGKQTLISHDIDMVQLGYQN